MGLHSHVSILGGFRRTTKHNREEVREHVLQRAERAVVPRHRRLAPAAVERTEDVVGDFPWPDHDPLQGLREPLLGEAFRLGEARLDGVDANAAAPQFGRDRARERELRVLRRRVRAARRAGDDA